MYSLRLSLRDADGCPVKFVELPARDDSEAIKLGHAQIAEQIPEGYTLTRVRVCRCEHAIWP
jgi:hypothetical protein